MVRITTRALKTGVQTRFYPISTKGFHTFFPKNFGQAYYTYILLYLENALSIQFFKFKICTVSVVVCYSKC